MQKPAYCCNANHITKLYIIFNSISLNITITKIITNIQEHLETESMIEKVSQYKGNWNEHAEEMTPQHSP
jgi:hypothetical protein